MLAASPEEQGNSQAAGAAREKAEWCHREYVSAKDCDEWVADQLARRVARKADEERRQEERRADEEARRAARKADEERQQEGHAHDAGAPHDTQREMIKNSGSAPEVLMMLAASPEEQGNSQAAGAAREKA